MPGPILNYLLLLSIRNRILANLEKSALIGIFSLNDDNYYSTIMDLAFNVPLCKVILQLQM
jgi:hypothetical protein